MKPLKIPRALGCLHLGVRGVTPDTSLHLSHRSEWGGSLALPWVCVGGESEGAPL